MKIFYAVQATGNGHISRAMELLPHLQQYGSVDIFLSGDNSNLALDAPIKYRSKGLSLYYNCNGGLDFWQLFKEFQPLRLKQEIRDLPVEKYDLIINDFDYITAAACAKKKIPSVNFGHQASFLSTHTPRPAIKSKAGEWVLKNYAKAPHNIGLHFKAYDDFIFTPVIKREILNAEPADAGYITVYLPSYCEPQLLSIFGPFTDTRFEIFCSQTRQPKTQGHITLLPVNKALFNKSFIHCSGIITGGGFETPAEALHMGKKIISVPIRSQYEQQCNAAALKQLGILTLKNLDAEFSNHFTKWMNERKSLKMDYSKTVPQCLDYLFNNVYSSLKREKLELHL
ncbi:glycosyltransferase family protein [Terrimonas alba]|uniref:glycosyltransferase family protein n=1 Tax=Terrimonas alba TaxID=3349636 RepID=UPI0035F3E657